MEGACTIDLTEGWRSEAEKRGLTLVSTEWIEAEGAWRVILQDETGQQFEGFVPRTPGGPLAIRYHFAALCEEASGGDPEDFEFYGRNLLPPWLR